MVSEISENSEQCPDGDISAYIDGELSPAEELELEMHLAGCRACTEELNLQKSFLQALNASLENESEIELPENFTRTVVTNAESRVRGLRGASERLNAIFICAALFLFALFALGSDAEGTFGTIGALPVKIGAVAAALGHFVFDISLAAAIIVRTISATFVSYPKYASALFAFVLIAAIIFFSRLLLRHRRA
jgi:anti-sigma factor RsiW